MTTSTPTDTESTDTRWTRSAILHRVDADGWTENQKAAFVAAIRNPDASRRAIDKEAGASGVGISVIGNLIWSFEHGLAGTRGGAERQGYTLDFPIPDTRGFDDRTAKQKAVIDFYARHPDANQKLSHKAASAAIAELYDVRVHYNTVASYRRKWPGTLAKRRERYESEGLIESIDDADAERWEPETDTSDTLRPVRGDLERLGFDLPDENLDGLPTVHEAHRAGLERAAEARREKAAAGELADRSDRDRVTRRVGARAYEGPTRGLDLAGDSEPRVLAPKLRSERVGEELADEFERVREENGPYGEDAFMRKVEIEDKDDLVEEIRHLRMIISTQGALIHDLRDTLEGMRLDVGVRFDRPTEDDDD